MRRETVRRPPTIEGSTWVGPASLLLLDAATTPAVIDEEMKPDPYSLRSCYAPAPRITNKVWRAVL
jgi:hypothetical protein